MKRYLFIIIFLTSCTGVFLHPAKERVASPKDFGLDYNELILQDGLGPELIIWDLPARSQYKATVLFLHGNAENISTHQRSVTWMPEYGFRVVLFDYRGYGGSKGKPNLAGAHQDAERMFLFLKKIEPDSNKRVIFGQSLGASIGLYLAEHNAGQFATVIADSAFSSYREIAREKLAIFWFSYIFQYPLGLLINDNFSAKKYVASIKAPILFLHGEDDKIVPVHHSQELYDLRPLDSSLWIFPGKGHIEAIHERDTRDRIIQWLLSN